MHHAACRLRPMLLLRRGVCRFSRWLGVSGTISGTSQALQRRFRVLCLRQCRRFGRLVVGLRGHVSGRERGWELFCAFSKSFTISSLKRLQRSNTSSLTGGGYHMVFTRSFGMSSSSSSWPAKAKKAFSRTFLVISLAEA